MRHLCWTLGLCVWLAASAALAADAGQAARAAPEENAPDIAPEAVGPIRSMCDFIKSQAAFSFSAEVATEQVFPNGQTIQLTRYVDMSVKRPDKLYARITGDERDRVFVYDGKTVAVADLDRGVYAILDAPPTIDATLDMLSSKYGFYAPTSDILYADPCAAILENVRTGDHVGEHMAAGRRCDHLAFSQKNADWQVWIDKGKPPLPWKFVLTDKEVMGWPQYSVTYTNWSLRPRLPEGLFTFTPARDARRIDFAPLVSGQGEAR